MASSLPEADLTRARELGKYSQATESQSGNERPHEKGRSLTAEEVDIIRKCAGCGKNMRKVKSRFVCSCKMAIHCSKECLKSSKHKCKEVGAGENLPVDKISAEENYERNVCAKFNEVMNACQHRYLADRNAEKGPSSDKVTWLLKVTRGEQKRILRYAESGNPTAAYVVGSSYADRHFDRRSIFTIPQNSNLDGRTSYLISCKHDEDKSELELELSESALNKLKSAGKCVFCVEEARQRLRAVSLGLFSIMFGMNDYAARYANEDGILVQDVFGAYSKPCMRQMLQCLMTNPADLHPLAIAEDANLFWPIIWFWGSVYEAVEDACNKATLEAIYHSLGDKSAASLGDKCAGIQGDKSAASLGDKNAASLGDKNAASLGDKNAASQGDMSAASQGDKSSDSLGDKRAGSQGNNSADSKSGNASALAAFPEDAAGEWRIACGNDYCPRVDHEVKFNLCAGCGIRRYCDTACQKKDWSRHIKFCKPSKKEGK